MITPVEATSGRKYVLKRRIRIYLFTRECLTGLFSERYLNTERSGCVEILKRGTCGCKAFQRRLHLPLDPFVRRRKTVTKWLRRCPSELLSNQAVIGLP